MNYKLKLTRIGNSVGVVLPRELLAQLRMEKGDEVYLSETPDGFKMTAYDADFAAQMEVAEKVMRRRRNLLHALSEN